MLFSRHRSNTVRAAGPLEYNPSCRSDLRANPRTDYPAGPCNGHKQFGERVALIVSGLASRSPQVRTSAARSLEDFLRGGSALCSELTSCVKRRLVKERDPASLRTLLGALAATDRLASDLRQPLIRIAFKSSVIDVWTSAAALLHRDFGSVLVAQCKSELKRSRFLREARQQRAIRLLGQTSDVALRPLAAATLLEQVRAHRRIRTTFFGEAERFRSRAQRAQRAQRAHALVESLLAFGGREGAFGLLRCLGGRNRHFAESALYSVGALSAKPGVLVGEIYAAGQKHPDSLRLKADLVAACRNLNDELLMPFVVSALFLSGNSKAAMRVRSEAVRTLRACARSCGQSHIVHIADGLRSPDNAKRRLAARGLRALGEWARPGLPQVLSALGTESDPKVLVPLVGVLNAARTPDSRLALVSLSRDEAVPSQVRLRAARFLEVS